VSEELVVLLTSGCGIAGFGVYGLRLADFIASAIARHVISIRHFWDSRLPLEVLNNQDLISISKL
jgi:uncharacterized membrane protein